MRDAPGDYSRLLKLRAALFPHFAEDQAKAAESIAEALADSVRAKGCTTIVDIGCGTGEVLDQLVTRLYRDRGWQLRGFGVDVSHDEIAFAHTLKSDCRFFCGDGEDLPQFAACLGKPHLEWRRTAVTAVGHTITHLQRVDKWFDQISDANVPVVYLDFHQTWNVTLNQLSSSPETPVRELRECVAADGTAVQWWLRTSSDPRHAGRVLRGIDGFVRKDEPPFSFWTTQLARASDWYVAEFAKRGYRATTVPEYLSGYGPMTGFVFVRRGM